MNKQLTKKSIGIAASAALMATVALSSNAFAARGGVPQASLGVSTWCEIADADVASGWMTVHVKLEDKSSGNAYAILESAAIVVGSKDKGKDFDYDNSIAEKNATAEVAIDNMWHPVRINLCTEGADYRKAINAMTTAILANDVASKTMYTAQCSNAPGPDGLLGTDDDVSIGGLKTADYDGLCSDPPESE